MKPFTLKITELSTFPWFGAAAFIDASARDEITRILRTAADHVEAFGLPNENFPLRDINGNIVGYISMDE